MTLILTSSAPGGDSPQSLAEAQGVVASWVEVSPTQLDEASLVSGLADVAVLRAQVDELAARLTVEADARGLAREHGCASTPAFVASMTCLPRTVAAALMSRGRLMSDARCEPTRHAWATGRIYGEQAEVIGRAVSRLRTGVDHELILQGQTDLVTHAQTLTLEQLKVLANRWVEVVDPDTADALLGTALEAEEATARQEATFRGRVGLDGIARFSGKLPSVQYQMLTRALESIASPRRPASRPGNDPVQDQQASRVPHRERLGQALCELIEHLPVDDLPDVGGVNATIVVTIDNDQLRDNLGAATLDTGAQVSAGQVRRLACNARLLPAVLGSDSAVLDLGMGRRLFSRHQRHALAVRDGGCIWAGCDRPPSRCEAHHLTPWSRGGPTDLANGVLLCSFHHHLLHSGDGWDIHVASDGTPEIIPPARLDPTRTPRRHHRLRHRHRHRASAPSPTARM